MSIGSLFNITQHACTQCYGCIKSPKLNFKYHVLRVQYLNYNTHTWIQILISSKLVYQRRLWITMDFYINSKSMMKHTNIHIIIFQLWSLLNINQPIKLTLSTDRLTRTCDQLCRMFEHQNVTQFSLVSPYLILRLGQARVWSPIPQFQQNSLQKIVGHYMGQYGNGFWGSEIWQT